MTGLDGALEGAVALGHRIGWSGICGHLDAAGVEFAPLSRSELGNPSERRRTPMWKPTRATAPTPDSSSLEPVTRPRTRLDVASAAQPFPCHQYRCRSPRVSVAATIGRSGTELASTQRTARRAGPGCRHVPAAPALAVRRQLHAAALPRRSQAKLT